MLLYNNFYDVTTYRTIVLAKVNVLERKEKQMIYLIYSIFSQITKLTFSFQRQNSILSLSVYPRLVVLRHNEGRGVGLDLSFVSRIQSVHTMLANI